MAGLKLKKKAVARALYDGPLERLIEGYRLSPRPDSPEALVAALLENLEQEAHPIIPQAKSDAEVFKAAVLALGSGMRDWTKFKTGLSGLQEALGDPGVFDPERAARVNPESVIRFVPGVNQTSTAKAIIAWAQYLVEDGQNYYSQLLNLYDDVLDRGQHLDLQEPAEVMIVVTSLLGYDNGPPRAWDGLRLPKWLGMGYALGSEFLRNLGWSGFKPDTHILRLLGRWAGEVVDAQEDRARALVGLTGRRASELVRMAKFSLAGMAITPEGMSYSEADNLLWLLGSQVVKVDREGDYRRDVTRLVG